jgi:DivIVA domain-containing protein
MAQRQTRREVVVMDPFGPRAAPKNRPTTGGSGWELPTEVSDTIRHMEFPIARRGYAPDQVREYLTEVARWFDELNLKVAELEVALRKAREGQVTSPDESDTGGGDPYGSLASKVAEVLRSADEQAHQYQREVKEAAERHAAEVRRQAEQVQEEAREKAERLLREAEEARANAAAELERAHLEAQAEAEQVRDLMEHAVREAEAEASRVVDALLDRRKALLEELHGLLGRIGSLTGELESDIATIEGEGTDLEAAEEDQDQEDVVVDIRPDKVPAAPDWNQAL